MLHIYTWYSNDGKTWKMTDYILAEKIVQQYITDCRVMRGFDFQSDHRLLKTTLCTPSTRRARYRKYNLKKGKPKLQVSALLNPVTQKEFVEKVSNEFQKTSFYSNSIPQMHDNIIKVLNTAAEETLPCALKYKQNNEL